MRPSTAEKLNRPVRLFPNAPAPEKIEFDTTPVRAEVRRMTQADVDKHAPWLVPLIQELRGGPSSQVVFGWLRSWMLSNEYNLVCTDNAAGLAILSHEAGDPVPVVSVAWTFARGDKASEEIPLFKHWITWAKQVHASELRFSKSDSDRKELLRQVIPGFKWRPVCYLEIE